MLFTGCASHNLGYGPNFYTIDKSIKKIAILSPDLYTYDVSGGGIHEFRLDWSLLGEKNLAESIRLQLNRRGFEGIIVYDNEQNLNLDTITSFVKFTASVIANHLYGKNPFLPQIDTFDYSVGSLSDLCNRLQVNAVMFLFGSDEHFSNLRKETLEKAAAVKTAKSAVWGTMSMLLLGAGTINTYSVAPERSFLCCVVADAQGKIIWYKKYFGFDNADMCKKIDTEKLVKIITNGFYPGIK